MRTVVIESPLQGGSDREADNLVYLRRCLADSLRRGEAPFASHGLYPGTLDDTVPEQRSLGMRAGWAIAERLEASTVYLDRGVTPGMIEGIKNAYAACRPIEYRMFFSAKDSTDLSTAEAWKLFPELAKEWP